MVGRRGRQRRSVADLMAEAEAWAKKEAKPSLPLTSLLLRGLFASLPPNDTRVHRMTHMATTLVDIAKRSLDLFLTDHVASINGSVKHHLPERRAAFTDSYEATERGAGCPDCIPSTNTRPVDARSTLTTRPATSRMPASEQTTKVD
jgi:hypothetical protein